MSVDASCDGGGSAVEAIAEHQPDVAFLDIRMPGLTGLEVASAAADASPRTQVVFVTAYDQYAIDAFDNGAVDYLLKPVTREQIGRAHVCTPVTNANLVSRLLLEKKKQHLY